MLISQERKYIDIHTHILPGIDDGARDGTETAKMLKIAAKEEIRVIIATPHFVPNIHETEPSVIAQTVKEINELSYKFGIEINVYQGNELYLLRGACESLERGKCLTLAGSDYVLCEMPMNEVPGDESMSEMKKMLNAGYKPILAHPERYAWFEKGINLFQALIEMGCVLQVNSDSITGNCGKFVQKNAEMLLSASMVKFISSDCHDSRYRVPNMKSVHQKILKKYGNEAAEQLLYINADSIIYKRH